MITKSIKLIDNYKFHLQTIEIVRPVPLLCRRPLYSYTISK